MAKRIDKLTGWLDKVTEAGARRSAQTMGRRHMISRMGTYLVAGAMLPVLPFDRSGGAAYAEGSFGMEGKAAQDTDDQSCDYWRYCALSGTLCTSCGGSLTECSPGSELSKVSWVGTCEHPSDGRHYLISYSDCCGGGGCGGEAVDCHGDIRERPGYRMGLYNNINWCMANESVAYHCTVAAIVGVE